MPNNTADNQRNTPAGGRRRLTGLGLCIAGVALLAVSVLGLVFSWGSTNDKSPAQVQSGAPTATMQSSASPAPSAASTALAQQETVAQFLQLFATALQTGDATFLIGRLNPHVIEVYGQANCAAMVAAMTDPTASFTINATSGPAPFVWSESGTPVPVNDVYTVSVTRVAQGQSSVQDIHLALLQGQLTWFRKCTSTP
jgi:hypothetical protein